MHALFAIAWLTSWSEWVASVSLVRIDWYTRPPTWHCDCVYLLICGCSCALDLAIQSSRRAQSKLWLAAACFWTQDAKAGTSSSTESLRHDGSATLLSISYNKFVKSEPFIVVFVDVSATAAALFFSNVYQDEGSYQLPHIYDLLSVAATPSGQSYRPRQQWLPKCQQKQW